RLPQKARITWTECTMYKKQESPSSNGEYVAVAVATRRRHVRRRPDRPRAQRLSAARVLILQMGLPPIFPATVMGAESGEPVRSGLRRCQTLSVSCFIGYASVPPRSGSHRTGCSQGSAPLGRRRVCLEKRQAPYNPCTA